jgi:thiol-disulfide isomerase/thioredoxin
MLVLRAVKHETAESVPGLAIRIELERYSRPDEIHRVTTDPRGRASIEYALEDLKRVAWVVENDAGWVGPEGEWLKQRVARMPGEVEVKVSRGVEIGGVVLAPDGRPVSGAEVWFSHPVRFQLSTDSPGLELTWVPSSERPIALTDSNGRWRARALWPGTHWAALRVRHVGFAEGIFSTEITEAMAAEGHGDRLALDELLQGTARLAMRAGVSVRGRVLDVDGRPVPDAEVRYAVERPGPSFFDMIRPTQGISTDQEGRFVAAHLEGRRAMFAVQLPGHAPAVGELTLSDQPGEVMLQLRKPVTFSGRVVDHRAEKALAGVRVSFRDWGIWTGVRWEGVTDGEGRFRWPDAPAERFQVRFEREGFIPQRKVVEASDEVVIRLNPALRLTGKVADAETQEPLREFRIVWSHEASMLPFQRRDAISGSEGTYTLDLGRLNAETFADGYPHQFLFRLEAEEYAPFMSRTFSSREGDTGGLQYDVELRPVKRVTVVVLGPDGKPAEGAQVAFKGGSSRLRLAGKPRFEDLDGIRFPMTDHEGKALLTPDPGATHVLAVHERGIGWMEAGQLDTTVTLRLERWARIEGTAFANYEPLPGEKIYMGSSFLQGRPGPGVFHAIELVNLHVETDAQGRFEVNYVPPARCSLYRMIPNATGSASGPQEMVEPKPGETALVTLGGRGRPVVGRFTVKNPYTQIDWQRDHHWINAERPKHPVDLNDADAIQAWHERTDVRRAHGELRNYPIRFARDGSFRIDEVVPGRYTFGIRILDPRDPDAMAYQRHIAESYDAFEVPDLPGRDSREPLDLGVFQLSLKPQIERGETPAPGFTAVDLTGKPLASSDFKGKYVLLDFWATWCGPCIAELPYLRAAHDRFGTRNDFVMLSLSLDEKRETARDFVGRNKMPWRHAYLGPFTDSEVPEKYGVSGIPAMFLINPEGKFVATGLRGPGLAAVLEEVLK